MLCAGHVLQRRALNHLKRSGFILGVELSGNLWVRVLRVGGEARGVVQNIADAQRILTFYFIVRAIGKAGQVGGNALIHADFAFINQLLQRKVGGVHFGIRREVVQRVGRCLKR